MVVQRLLGCSTFYLCCGERPNSGALPHAFHALVCLVSQYFLATERPDIEGIKGTRRSALRLRVAGRTRKDNVVFRAALPPCPCLQTHALFIFVSCLSSFSWYSRMRRLSSSSSISFCRSRARSFASFSLCISRNACAICCRFFICNTTHSHASRAQGQMIQ